MISNINFNRAAFLGAKFCPFKTSFQNKLEKSPSFDTVSFKGKIRPTKLTDALRAELDRTVFNIRKPSGGEYIGTIRDYFHNAITSYQKIHDPKMPMVHCTQYKETATKIVSEGLDWTKATRTKCGPGTYFSRSPFDGDAHGSGRCPVYGIYTGTKTTYPVFEPCFYEGLDVHPEITETIKKSTGEEHVKETLSRYCHEILCDEMGIDFLYSSTGRAGGCFVVLNDDCMKLSENQKLHRY